MWRATLTRWTLALTSASLLYGCGRDSEPKSHRFANNPIDAAAAAAEADLVSAVSPAGSVGPVGLKFKLPEPPRVGQPLALS